MTIKELVDASGMSQVAIAAEFKIPIRTLNNWYLGTRTPPAYVVAMMAELLGIPNK